MRALTTQQERRWREYRLGQLARQLVDCDDERKAKRITRSFKQAAADLLALAEQQRAERRAAEPGAGGES